jgi:anti-sigma factor RsiW
MEHKEENNCNLFEKYRKGELTAKERKMFKKHLEKCHQCRDKNEALPDDAGEIFSSESPFGGKLTDEEKKELKRKILERITKGKTGQ